MTAAIEIDGVTKNFGSTRAVDNVSFEVPERSIFGLLGPNGAGKTTLFSLVASFLRPNSGAVRVEGIDVRNVSKLRGRLSILPQDAQFQANVPVLEQVIFFAMLSGSTRHDAEKAAMDALALVGLEEQAKKGARVLSHGMSKRLGIAQAFLGEPSVILLDEPTAGLDPKAARGIRDLIANQKVNGTLVISSHDLAEIQRMCDTVAIMRQGKLVECAKVSDLTRNDGAARLTFAKNLDDAQQASIRGVAGVANLVVDAAPTYGLVLDPEGNREEIIAKVVQTLAAAGVVARSIEDDTDLESRFLELTD